MAEVKDEGLKIFDGLDLKEVSKLTHIEIEYLKAIVNKDFEKLRHKNIKAYIKILEREYNIDLQTLLDEYNAFVGDEIEESRPYLMPIARKSSGFSMSQAQSRGGGWLIWIVLILIIIIVWVIIYFKIYENFNFITNLFGDKNESIQYSKAGVVERVEDKLENIGIVVPKFDENKTTVEIVEKPLQTNSNEANTSLNALDKAILAQNEANQTLTDDSNATSFVSDENNTIKNNDEKTIELKTFEIVPKNNLWIGIIDLKTGKKSTVSTSNPYKISLSKEQLILTGHGILDINVGGKTTSYKDSNPIRFYVKDGKVEKIDYNKFLELNSGKAW